MYLPIIKFIDLTFHVVRGLRLALHRNLLTPLGVARSPVKNHRSR